MAPSGSRRYGASRRDRPRTTHPGAAPTFPQGAFIPPYSPGLFLVVEGGTGGSLGASGRSGAPAVAGLSWKRIALSVLTRRQSRRDSSLTHMRWMHRLSTCTRTDLPAHTYDRKVTSAGCSCHRCAQALDRHSTIRSLSTHPCICACTSAYATAHIHRSSGTQLSQSSQERSARMRAHAYNRIQDKQRRDRECALP